MVHFIRVHQIFHSPSFNRIRQKIHKFSYLFLYYVSLICIGVESKLDFNTQLIAPLVHRPKGFSKGLAFSRKGFSIYCTLDSYKDKELFGVKTCIASHLSRSIKPKFSLSPYHYVYN